MATFVLTVRKIKFDNNEAVDAVFSDYTTSSFNLITGKKVDGGTPLYPSVFVEGTLVSLDVHKRIGTHNNIKVRLKLIKGDNAAGELNVTLLKKAFLRREVKLTVNDSLNMQKYYVFGVNPLYQKENDRVVYYVDLDIYSWDRLMDIKKYSKSYSAMKLSGILNSFKNGYKNAPETFNISGMRTLVVDDGNTKKELNFSFLEQCDETEYNFILRTANRCGEFFYFENDTLNLGLTRITVKNTKTGKEEEVVTSITGQSSIEPLSCENYVEYDLTNFTQDFVDEESPLCTPTYDKDSTTFGTKNTAKEDSDDKWMELNPPTWSRYLSRVFEYENIASLFKDSLESELSARNIAKTKSKSFNDKVKNFNVTYTPDEEFFSKVRKAECIVANNQYRITFDGSQKSIKLGDLVTCESIDTGNFVVVDVHSKCEFVFNNGSYTKTEQKMEVTVVPVFSKDKKDYCYPLPMDASQDYAVCPEAGVVPKSNTRCDSPLRLRTATVTNREDPFRLNRVRVQYDDENSSSDEWISVLTPFASGDKGISCKLIEDAKVLVLQNIECGGKVKSFVIGSYYDKDKDDNHHYNPPYGQRKFTTIIRSKNGQYIGFEESNRIKPWWTNLLPELGLFKSIFPNMLTKETDNEDELLSSGGIEISDNYGFFTIGASSTNRHITISSPFGTVGIDAAMGITISAPNGNVKIVGKNIDIEAGNNLTLKSGTNIDSYLLAVRSKSGLEECLKAEGQTLVDAVTGLFDIPALRFVIELLFKPIAGTLKVHSGRNLLLEADGTDAHFQDHTFSVQNHCEIVGYDIKDKIKALVRTITNRINSFKTYKAIIVTGYEALRVARQHIYDDIMRNCNSKNGDEVKILLSKNLNNLIDDWLKDNSDFDKNKLKDHLVVRNGVTDADTFITKICDDITNLKTQLNDFNNFNTYGKEKCDSQDDFSQYFSVIRKPVYSTDLNYGDSELEDKLFITLDSQKQKLRLYVKSAFVPDEKCEFGYDVVGTSLENDEEWIKMIDSIKIKKTKGEAFWTGLANTGLDILNNILPIESVNTFMWRQEDKGKILMSQHVDSTLSINGQTLKEEFDGTSLASVREAMRNATL